MYMYAFICSIHRKQQFWQKHIWQYKQFYVHVYFLFYYAVQILYVKPLLFEYRKGTGTALLWYDRSSNFHPRTR